VRAKRVGQAEEEEEKRHKGNRKPNKIRNWKKRFLKRGGE
jgi:hypothetical protein